MVNFSQRAGAAVSKVRNAFSGFKSSTSNFVGKRISEGTPTNTKTTKTTKTTKNIAEDNGGGEKNPSKFEKFLDNNRGKFLIADLLISLAAAVGTPFLFSALAGGGGGDEGNNTNNKDGVPISPFDFLVQSLPWLVICICSILCCCCLCLLLLIAAGSGGDGGGNNNGGRTLSITPG